MTNKARLATVAGSVVLALTLTACGGAAEEATPAQSTDTTDTPTQSPAETNVIDADHNEADTAFAQMMIVHHEGAIEMAELAVERAATNEVRTLAEGIAAAQGPEIERMTSWLETWGENPAPAGDMAGMDHSGMDMGGLDQDAAMEELESLSGTKFDRRFLELMTEHHRGAVEMAEAQLRAGQNPEALELAQQIIDDQTTEIALMATMLEDL